MKTAFNQYLNNENTQGFNDLPKAQSSFTIHTCLVYGVLNHNTCFSLNCLFYGFIAATFVFYNVPLAYIYVT